MTVRWRLLRTTGDLTVDLASLDVADIAHDAGGLGRQLRVFRLPNDPLKRELSLKRSIAVNAGGDTPIWICVTTEDGYQAWSSPIYLFKS